MRPSRELPAKTMTRMPFLRCALGWAVGRALGWALVCALAAAPLRAQVVLGRPVPTGQWKEWLQGEAIASEGEHAPACTVYAFYTRDANKAAFSSDAWYLADLQRRFGERGLAVVAVVGEQPADLGAWQGCRVALDGGERTAAWFGEEPSRWYVVAVDRRQSTVFLGWPEAGLVDAIEAVLEGLDRFGAEKSAFTMRLDVAAGFDDLSADAAVEHLESLLRHAPRDGTALGLLYLTYATKRCDAAGAEKVRERALKVLAAESRPFAAFADLALRGDPTGEGLAKSLAGWPLRQFASDAPNDLPVQLACLRALVLAGEGREVGRHAMRMQKAALASASACLDFVSILTRDEDAMVHVDLANRLLLRAEVLGAPPRLVTAARYGIATRCQQDPAAAKKLLDAYLEDVPTTINNDCWYLMTELSTLGRFDWFALGLAERMLEQRESMGDYQFDTAALAMFLAGRVDEAIELQRIAIEKSGEKGGEYGQRLQRYELRARASTPR
jgi:hypothetical protein